MSGWIKVEKALENDPRVLRMAKGLDRLFTLFGASHAEFDPCNAVALPTVTLVCGALTRLWMYADSHVRDDNTLDMGASELDEWLGIPNFCSLIPKDWLVEVDESHVELPGFQEHNGVEAKKRALTQKRVANHRNARSLRGVNKSNATALPDQTRPDQTRPSENPSASAPPTRKSGLKVSRGSEPEDPDWLLDFKLAYPARAGDQAWRKAVRAANARMAEGHFPREFVAGAERYAKFCEATEKIGTEFVKQAASFLGPDKPFLLPWTLPTQAETAMEEIQRLNGGHHAQRGRVFDAEPSARALEPPVRAVRG